MKKHNPANERIKRKYFAFLKEAKRHSEPTIDAAAKALNRFEVYTKFRDFKTFHFEQAIAFKKHFAVQKGQRSGEKLSKARLRHKHKWLDYLNAIKESLTIRKAATGVGLNLKTSFRWRHRFLAWIASDHPEALHGITEADETYLLESHKGSRYLSRKPRERGGRASKRGLFREQICILIARDRAGSTVDFVTGRGPVNTSSLINCLKPVLDADALLVSDGHSAYQIFCQAENLSHQVINLSKGKRVKGAFHLQNVNAYHSRLKAWLQRFHGVATKYLPNYLGWRRSLEQHPIISPEALLGISLGQFP